MRETCGYSQCQECYMTLGDGVLDSQRKSEEFHSKAATRARRKAWESSNSHKHPINQGHHEDLPLSIRIAEAVTRNMGSMRFIVIQTAIILVWIGLNLAAAALRWDPYPFILLNLVFSTQAAYAAPFIMLAQNRASEKDRQMAEFDFKHNSQSLALLKALHADAHGEDCSRGCLDLKD